MANKIIVFTLNGCVHCNELKKQLIKENIDFTELEIDENKKYGIQLLNKQDTTHSQQCL